MSGELIEKKGGARIIGHGGGKKGSKSRTPVEARDSLHSIAYARVVDLISEGEIYGPVHGLEDMLRDIYLDGTPIASESGSLNFSGVTVDFRSGTQTQDPVPGFPASEVTTNVGVELRSDAPWVRVISNRELSAVRVTLAVNALSKMNTSNGDINGYSVAYVVELSTDGGAYESVISTSFTGKTTQRYARSHRVDLPPANTGWQLRVRRTTPNANSGTVADTTIVDAITEIIDARLRYPMSAVVGIQVDAQQFQSVPSRAYHMRGRIVRVPANYDPEVRVYSGVWDGTFKLAWTNNPAWVFFDLVTNDRYGLGDVVPAGLLDKWQLYAIGQYCDESVPDGKGGTEPRFACNVYIQQRSEAWKVIQDLASVFRGIVFYASGTVITSADMPRDPVYTFANANVVDGKFGYAGSTLSTRYTVALVSWNDMTAMGVAKVEPVQDDEAVARYGLRQTEISAFGCTSQGQAQRVGRWMLATSSLETDTVSFAVGLDGAIAMPGQVIRVADRNRAGRRIGGRVVAATASTVTLDRAVTDADAITVILPSGISETRNIASLAGRVVTVTSNFSAVPVAESVWSVEADDLATQLFRVISIAERANDERMIFDVVAVRHVPGKYDAIDYQTIIQLPPVTVIPPSVQPPPATVTISSYTVISQGISSTNAVIQWEAAESAVYYDVQWRRDNGGWVTIPRTGSAEVEIQDIFSGDYLVRVRAVNALEGQSVWAYSTLTTLDGIIGPPPVVTHINAKGIPFGIELAWGFPVGPSIIAKTELRYSQSVDFIDAIPLGDFSYPQNTHTLMGLSAGAELYFWARLVDKNGTPGEWYPAGNGVLGTASADAGQILDYLTGQITNSQLSQELMDEIDAGGEGAILAVQQIQNDLSAMYTIKTQYTLDDRLYLAGIGVGVENNDGIIESQVLIAADRFAVIHPNNAGGVTTPFAIQGDQVFINTAIIGEATIGSGKLQDWLVSDTLDENDNPILGINFRTGTIRSGYSAYGVGSGFWLGSDGGVVKLRAGSSERYFEYDGVDFKIVGDLIVTENIVNDAISDGVSVNTDTLANRYNDWGVYNPAIINIKNSKVLFVSAEVTVVGLANNSVVRGNMVLDGTRLIEFIVNGNVVHTEQLPRWELVGPYNSVSTTIRNTLKTTFSISNLGDIDTLQVRYRELFLTQWQMLRTQAKVYLQNFKR